MLLNANFYSESNVTSICIIFHSKYTYSNFKITNILHHAWRVIDKLPTWTSIKWLQYIRTNKVTIHKTWLNLKLQQGHVLNVSLISFLIFGLDNYETRFPNIQGDCVKVYNIFNMARKHFGGYYFSFNILNFCWPWKKLHITYNSIRNIIYLGCIRVILKNDYLWRRRYKNYFQTRTPKKTFRAIPERVLWGLSQKINAEKLTFYPFACN